MSAGDSARAAILGAVRAGLRGTDKTPLTDVPRAYATTRPVDDLVTWFSDRVADYQASVHRIGDEDPGIAVVSELRECGVTTAVLPSGLPWRDLVAESLHEVHDDAAMTTQELDTVGAVVTTAAVGIASTGTIILDHQSGQGRRAVTLVPDVHVCVIAAHQIVDDVPAALARVDPKKPLTFISGPSATSDIELDRVEGVHGPRSLRVLITESVR